MKHIVFLITLAVLFISCKSETKEIGGVNETKTIEIPMLAIGEFDAKAGEFVNKEIQINGIVDHVCKHGGKKILMVTDDGDVHVTSDERFDEDLKGNEISLIGIVVEERIDESTCLQMEENNMNSHSEGNTNEEQFNQQQKIIQQYRDEMKAENKAYISNYSLKHVSHSKVE